MILAEPHYAMGELEKGDILVGWKDSSTEEGTKHSKNAILLEMGRTCVKRFQQYVIKVNDILTLMGIALCTNSKF